MDNSIDQFSDFKPEKIFDIFDSIENLNSIIKNRLLENVNERLKLKITPKNFRILSLKTRENRNTEYPGFSIDIDPNKALTVIKGENASGKTTTLDKICHFFLRTFKHRSKIKDWLTILELELEEVNSDQNRYIIQFHSQEGIEDGKRFKILKQEKTTLLWSPIANPQLFLEESLLIKYALNNTFFVPETSDLSFVSSHCSKEGNFRKLFRFPTLNSIFDLLEEEKKNLESEIDRLQKIVLGIKMELERVDFEIQLTKDDFEKDDFIVNSIAEFRNARTLFNEKSSKLKEQGRTVLKDLRSMRLREKNLRKEQNELNRLILPYVKTKTELFRAQQLRQCWHCDTIIPQGEFRRRFERVPSLCYICGIGDYDYSEEMSTIPDEDISEIRRKKDEIESELKSIKQEINNNSEIQDTILPCPKGISKKIWRRVKIFADDSDLEEELRNAKKRSVKGKERLEILNESREQIFSKQTRDMDHFNLLNSDYTALEEIKLQILDLEKESYENLKQQILEDANLALMNLSDETAGELSFDEKGFLTLTTTILIDEDTQRTIKRQHRYIDSKLDLSPGQFRKIDFAFALAFAKNMKSMKRRPLNVIMIDSLNFLNNYHKKYLLEGLSTINQFKTIVFDINAPEFLKEGTYQIKNIARNERVLKPENLKELYRQTTLLEFF